MRDSDKTWVEYDEEPVVQIDDDTIRVPMRACTNTDWPPTEPRPEEEPIEMADDLALGTEPSAQPAPRQAGVYAAVRRPTTSNES